MMKQHAHLVAPLQAAKVVLAIRYGVHPDEVSERRAFEVLPPIQQVIQAGLDLQRHSTDAMEQVMLRIDPDFGPHVPGCDGLCYQRPGSEQCFA